MSSEAQDSESSVSLPKQTSSIYKCVSHKCPLDKEVSKRDQKRLIAVSVVCLLFMTAEIIGGVISNSLAIASDAGHLLTDFGAFMVSLTALWLASKPRTPEMSFGFHRAEVLGALVSILSIWLLTGVLVYMAIQRMVYLDYELDALVMIYVSIFGIFANLIMGVILMFYKGGKPRDSEESLNIRSAIIHVLGDLIQSISVFIASLVIFFHPTKIIIDPVCTLIFSVIVLISTLFIMKDILRVLMEGFPKHLIFEDVKNVLCSVPGVIRIHNMRMWSLTMDKVALSAHMVIDKQEHFSDVLESAIIAINSQLDIHEVTLQLEEPGKREECSVCS